jgi:hypothetical protein
LPVPGSQVSEEKRSHVHVCTTGRPTLYHMITSIT